MLCTAAGWPILNLGLTLLYQLTGGINHRAMVPSTSPYVPCERILGQGNGRKLNPQCQVAKWYWLFDASSQRGFWRRKGKMENHYD